jgi:1,4-dihydroxy-2-naphthoate octaprenyltransferase
MPVFCFALSCVHQLDTWRALFAFFIIHLLVYPSSNGYNSYMDRDTSSIGGIRNPLAPERELFFVTIFLDILAIGLALLISQNWALMLFCYIICSRLYSYRGIRLKQFPVIGYLTVILNQGGLMFILAYQAASFAAPWVELPWPAVIASCFLIGGFYPITQVYQHVADKKDGVTTISILLGTRGTFIFCAMMYLLAFGFLFYFFNKENELLYFGVLQIFFLPVLVYFFKWVIAVWENPLKADFSHTMTMNWLASACTNLGFIILLIFHQIG